MIIENRNRAFLCLVLASVFLSLTFLLSCTSVSSQDSAIGEMGRVVGKSSFVRPAWVNANLSVDSGRQKAFLSYLKKNVVLLDLGLKQAQSEALSQSAKKFDEEFANYAVQLLREPPQLRARNGSAAASGRRGQSSRQRAMAAQSVSAVDYSSQLSANSAEWWSIVRGIALEASKSFEAPVVKSESVYWEETEKFEAGDSGGEELVRAYQVWVRVSLETSEITDRLSSFVDKLQKNGETSLNSSQRGERAEGSEGGAPGGANQSVSDFQLAAAHIEARFKELTEAKDETQYETKEVESIQTEMDSSGAEIDSSDEESGPKGRKVPQVIPNELPGEEDGGEQ